MKIWETSRYRKAYSAIIRSAPVPLNDVAHRLKPKVATEATKEYSKRPGNARSSFRVLTVGQPLLRGSVRIGTEHALTANKARRQQIRSTSTIFLGTNRARIGIINDVHALSLTERDTPFLLMHYAPG